MKVKLLCCVWLFVTPWTVAYQAPPWDEEGKIFQARVLEWIAISFSRGYSRVRNGTWVSRTAGRHFTIWVTGEAHINSYGFVKYPSLYKMFHSIVFYWRYSPKLCKLQFSSVSQLYPTLCDPIDCRTLGFPVHHQLWGLTQTQIHWVGDAIQPSHLLLSPSPSAFNLSQHHVLSNWISSLHQVAKVLEFQLQHQSFQWILRTDFL